MDDIRYTAKGLVIMGVTASIGALGYWLMTTLKEYALFLPIGGSALFTALFLGRAWEHRND